MAAIFKADSGVVKGDSSSSDSYEDGSDSLSEFSPSAPSLPDAMCSPPLPSESRSERVRKLIKATSQATMETITIAIPEPKHSAAVSKKGSETKSKKKRLKSPRRNDELSVATELTAKRETHTKCRRCRKYKKAKRRIRELDYENKDLLADVKALKKQLKSVTKRLTKVKKLGSEMEMEISSCFHDLID